MHQGYEVDGKEGDVRCIRDTKEGEVRCIRETKEMGRKVM